MPLQGAGAAEDARLAEARALDADLLEAIRRGWRDPLSELEWDALAARLFDHQARHNAVARAWWTSAGVRPGDVRRWRQVPPLPLTAYKASCVASFPPASGAPRFLSSGTTSAARSHVFLEDTALYEAAIPEPFRRHALADLERIRMLFLTPAPGRAPESSLSFMFGVLRERFGAPGSGFLGRLVEPPPGEPRAEPDVACPPGDLRAELEAACAAGEPVFLLGPAFAFVHALDALRDEGAGVSLPDGSRVLQTGGFKGRSREADPEELEAGYRRLLGVPRGRIVNEYGMAELSSQFYAGADGLYAGPPWVRWRVLDPLTLDQCAPGATGVLAVWDLANRSGCFAIRTQDLAVDYGGAFRLAGRLALAEPRGCSLDADLALAGAAGEPRLGAAGEEPRLGVAGGGTDHGGVPRDRTLGRELAAGRSRARAR